MQIWHGTEDTLAPHEPMRKAAWQLQACETHFIEGIERFLDGNTELWDRYYYQYYLRIRRKKGLMDGKKGTAVPAYSSLWLVFPSLAVKIKPYSPQLSSCRETELFIALKTNRKIIEVDSNGNILHAGDSVHVVKDLKVKGMSATLKQGNVIKNIRLTSSHEEVECRVGKSQVVVKTCFLKKA